MRHMRFVIPLVRFPGNRVQMGGIEKDITFGNIRGKESLSDDKHDGHFLKHLTLVGTIHAKLHQKQSTGCAGDRGTVVGVPNI